MSGLLVLPVAPAVSGGGLAMRGQATRLRLRRQYGPVSVVVPGMGGMERPVSERVRRFLHYQAGGMMRRVATAPGDWADYRLAAVEEAEAEWVHVYRLYLAPLVRRWVGQVPCRLDLDESEWRTRGRVAELARRNGDVGVAERWEWESRFYERAERDWLPQFAGITVSSEVERERLLARMGGLDVQVIPNTIPVPANLPQKVAHKGFRLLFIGGLGYYPNEDAIRFFLQEAWPRLEGQGMQLVIVGQGASHGLRELMARSRGVEVLGYVEDLERLYAEVDAAIVPIRAGGGTRIKILEAFARRLPVISTRIGAEGLGAADGVELLLAESGEEFVEGCLRLQREDGLRERMCDAGWALVRARYAG